ncbi:MAG: Ig domain-containing protein [Planctomycetaceae bacterium]
MTDPFVRVDLSQGSRDFQSIALEPGSAFLDRSNSSFQTLRKWLGLFAAEGERTGDNVAFYVRDEQGGRPESVLCVPISEKDIAGELATEFKELRRRLEAVKPQTPQEQLIHRVLLEQFKALNNEELARDRRCFLFKYRDQQKKLHLVWCVGYRRRDNEPLTAVVCTSPKCSHLFLPRRENAAKCPVCKVAGPPVPPPPPPSASKGPLLKKLLAAALLLAIGVGVGLWWKNQPAGNGGGKPNDQGGSPEAAALRVEPANWTGPVGGQVSFVIKHDSKDVTAATAVTVANPKILAVTPFTKTGKAQSPGKTEVTFFVNDLTAKATVTVEPRSSPTKLRLEPEQVTLAVGTTQRLKLIGEYPAGHAVDLTDEAEWVAQSHGKFFVHKGCVEGEEAGEATLRVRYRATSQDKPLEATAKVIVQPQKFTALKVSLNPATLTVGQPARMSVMVTSESGQEFSVDQAKGLATTISPAGQVSADGLMLTGLKPGDFQVSAKFEQLIATLESKVAPAPATTQPLKLKVSPQSLELKIGELARLDVVSGQSDSVRIVTSAPAIVQVTSDGRLRGDSVGEAVVEVSDGGEPVKVAVRVTAADWKSIALEPARLTVRAEESATVRVFGVLEDHSRVELAGDQIRWVTLPRAELVEFDRSARQLKGIKPTGESSERLTARVGNHESSAEITVIAAPIVLTLSPAGVIEIPFGQKRALRVQAQSGGRGPIDIPASEVEWSALPAAGFEIENGAIRATEEKAQTRLTAIYQGQSSNVLRIASIPATATTLKLRATPATLVVGDSGTLIVTATGPGGEVTLSDEGLRFESAQPKIINVADATGAFRALSSGTTTLRVTHPTAKQAAEVSITVTAPKPIVAAKPARLQFVVLGSKQVKPQPISLPVNGEFSEWRVLAEDSEGELSDVTRQATIEISGPPAAAPIVIRSGRIIGVSPGEATLHATYRGARTTDGFVVTVTETVDIDELQLVPTTMNLIVGESARWRVVGLKAGRTIGSVENLGELTWKAEDPDCVQLEGPLTTARRAGTTTITASFGKVVSQPATVTVVAPTASGEVGRLLVTPSKRTMRVGEVLQIGNEVTVSRGDADFSEQCEVVPSSDRIVTFQSSTRRLRAVSPGQARVTCTVRDQAATLDLEVIAADEPAADSRIVIEPAKGQLLVAEQWPIQVFVVSSDGTRTEVTAALKSSDTKIAVVSDSVLQGVSAGEVTLTARVPGIDQPGQAVFQVQDVELKRLVFQPSTLNLAVGQRQTFEVRAVTAQGQKRLGDDPDLKLTISDPADSPVELSASDRELFGLKLGQTSIVATWKGKLTAKLTVQVQADEFQELVISPEDATVAEGETLDFQVFARRGLRMQPLLGDDGVELQVANRVIAETVDGKLSVRGLKTGRTQVTARQGTRRIVASLNVTPRQKPDAPEAPGKSLRFIPDVRQMDLGFPGDGIRVIRVLTDGTEEDVGHLAKLTVREPQDVISIESTSSGPILRPKRIGQTQIDAALDNLRTQRPLLIEVTENSPRRHRLRASPSSLTLPIGEAGHIAQAEVMLATGGTPVPIPFKLTATPNKIFELRPDGTVQPRAAGQAILTVLADDPQKKYEGLSTSVLVEVTDPNEPDPQLDQRQLTLEGLSETSVETEVSFRVQVVAGDRSTDVTHKAQLVLTSGDEEVAEVRPGGRVFAKAPGKLSIQARLNDLTSAPHELLIRKRAAEFDRLELELSRESLKVGESRTYRLWGSPRGGGARQDLTGQLADEKAEKSVTSRPRIQWQTLAPNPDAPVVTHRPGAFVGQQPGRFRVQAMLGERLTSESIELDVVGSVSTPVRLRVEPDQIELLAGQTTPALQVSVAAAGERNYRTLAPGLAEFLAVDAQLLKAREAGQFVAIKPGQTAIQIKYQGLELSVPVRIKINPFARIEVGRDPKFKDNTMTVELTVFANPADGELEYRSTLLKHDENPAAVSEWILAERAGDQLKAQFSSPRIPLVIGQNEFHLILEARDRKDGSIVRTPFPFKLITGRQKPAE